jgi:hypothetical protein
MESFVAIGILSTIGILINKKSNKKELFTNPPVVPPNTGKYTITEVPGKQPKKLQYSNARITKQNVDFESNHLDRINGLPRDMIIERKEVLAKPPRPDSKHNRPELANTLVNSELDYSELTNNKKNGDKPANTDILDGPDDTFGKGRNTGLVSENTLNSIGIPSEYMIGGGRSMKKMDQLQWGNYTPEALSSLVNNLTRTDVEVKQVRDDRKNHRMPLPNTSVNTFKVTREEKQQKDAFSRLQVEVKMW